MKRVNDIENDKKDAKKEKENGRGEVEGGQRGNKVYRAFSFVNF